MKINKTSSALISISMIAAFLNGCASTSNDNLMIEENAVCGKIKPVMSLEQTLKRISGEEGFTPRIKNHTPYNPTVYAKDFIDLKTELENSNVDFEIHNYSDSMDVKRVDIYTKGDRYRLDKELMKMEYQAVNSKYMTIGELVQVFDKFRVKLDIPYHLQSKVVTLTPDATYKLSDLLNEITNRLISMNVFSIVNTSYNPDTKTDNISIILKEHTYKYPESTIKNIIVELKKYNIPFRETSTSVALLGNYKQQILAEEMISKQIKNNANIYVGCIKRGDSFEALSIRDGIEAPLDTYETIRVTKVSEDENGIENFQILHKTADGIKDYSVKTNESKVHIIKENINLKVKFF